jgi:xanthine dehydrogenase iron-sulfur cluster and FAD-binding subunit A
VSETPIQQAMEGVDTIMVGGAGKSADRNIFKLKGDGITNTPTTTVLDGTDLYIWGIDQYNDVIDLKEYISVIAPPVTASTNDQKLADYKTQIGSKVDPSGVANKFSVNLDNNDVDTDELTIHFMGMGATPVSEGTLEEMIARAYLS